MKTIVVTGIDGFLGCNFFCRLRNKYEIIGLVRNRKSLKRLISGQLTLYDSVSEIENYVSTHKIFAIVHLATVYEGEKEIQRFVNIELPKQLFNIALENGVALFLNADTFFSRLPQDYEYLQSYNQSKKECRLFLEKKSGVTKPIHMIIHHMYGPYDSSGKFIMKLFKDFTDGSIKFIPLTTGEQKRDFIYVDDVVSAFDTILNNSETVLRNQLVDICTGKMTAIRDVVELIKETTHSQIRLGYGELPTRKGEPDMDSIEYSNECLKALAWEPQVDLEQGLSKLYEWYVSA